MKLNPTLNKLSLIALLSLGLVCAPLVVNANDGDRGRHGQHQQHHGKPHHRTSHHKEYRGYGHLKHHGYRNGHQKDYKHGYKSGHHYYKPSGHHGHYTGIQRHYYSHDYDRPSFFLSLFSDDLDGFYRD